MALDEKEALERLVCCDIPNTKEMQRIQVKYLGGRYEGEEQMKKYYHKKWASPRRIVQLPKDDLKTIYELVIPLSFSQGDFNRCEGIELSFPRWKKGSSDDFGSYGAMHLTTQKNFDMLIEIFNKHHLPVKFEHPCEKVLDGEKQKRKAVSVPHHWYVDNWDPFEDVVYHQFVVCEEEVLAIPYYFVREEKLKEEECENHKSWIVFSQKDTLRKEFQCEAFFTSPAASGDLVPEKYITKRLKEIDNGIKDSFSSPNKNLQLVSSSVRLLKIGAPVVIYDPEWIRKA
jgi:hypothetical protein